MKQAHNRVRSRSSQAHRGAQIRLQHFAWAGAIRAKFVQKKPLGLSRETLTFLRMAKGRVLMFHERCLLQQFFSGRHTTLLRPVLMKEAVTPLRPVLTKEVVAPTLLQPRHSGSPLHAFRRQAFPFREAGRVVLDISPRATGRLALDRPVQEQQQFGAQLSRAGSFRRPIPFNPSPDLFAVGGQLLQRHSFASGRHARQEPPKIELRPSDIVTRIVRQLQRVETNAQAQQSARELRFSTSRPADMASMPAAAGRRRHLESEESQSAKDHAPAAPAINVAQITECVLQQLDRRLIAARERMGRI